MSINTTPVFYYGFTVTVNDIYLNFTEDSGITELTALISAGSYSFTDLASEIALRMNNIGGQEYIVTANRADRTYTISASGPSNFDLLFSSGSNSGLSIASVIGFAATDLTGANTYTSATSAGSEYIPQFPLQNYVGLDDFQEIAQASINESASGAVEVYSIGTRKFLEFNIGPITDNPMRKGSLFINNPNAVSELRSFLQYCITKGDLEFMADESDRSVLTATIILERTPSSGTGTGYKLRELYSRGLVGFFETGTLKFRERT